MIRKGHHPGAEATSEGLSMSLIDEPNWNKALHSNPRSALGGESSAYENCKHIELDHSELAWTGTRDVKAFLLLRQLMHLYSKYASNIGTVGWNAFVRFLLWARDNNGLPDGLDIAPDRKSKYPSLFEKECILRSTATEIMASGISEGSEKSIWLSVASLGGLLWSSSEGAVAAAALGATSSHSAARQLSQEEAVLLRRCLEASRVDLIFEHQTVKMEDSSLLNCLDLLLQLGSCVRVSDGDQGREEEESVHVVAGTLSPRSLSGTNSRTDSSHSSATASQAPKDDLSVITDVTLDQAVTTPRIIAYNQSEEIEPEIATLDSSPRFLKLSGAVSELDAVVLLDWCLRVIFANPLRIEITWQKLHGIFL